MIATSPLFGTGLGSFKWTYPAYESLNPDIPAVYAHNDYLQLIIEIGFIGFGLVLWAFVICLKTALKNLKSGDPLTRSIGLAAIGALVAVAIQEFVDYSLFIPGVAAMLVLLISLNEKVASLEKRGDLQAGDVKSISC